MPYGDDDLDTYYLYDSYDKLCAVLPPALSRSLPVSGTVSSSLVEQYAYTYRYDTRCRLVSKKMPGAEPVYMAYDEADRLLFVQDGVMRNEGKAVFHVYDVFGRECVTGVCQATLNYAGTASISEYACCQYTGQGQYGGYVIMGLSLISPQLLTVRYYDSYDFVADDSLQYVADAYANLRPLQHKGLLTGEKTRLLYADTTTAYNHTAYYYDEYNRLIQKHSTNHIGGYDHYFMEYDFAGNMLKKTHQHSSAHKTITVTKQYTYDHENRLLTESLSLGNGSPSTVVNNTYDALGRLSANSRNGSSSLQTSYSYNVRSWLASVISPVFSESLFYNTQNSVSSNTRCYNGSVSSIEWKANETKNRLYDFTYDHASRLLQSDYTEDNVQNQKYQTSYEYDANGNILSLVRKGFYLSGWQTIDNLSMAYDGNQLLAVGKTGVNPQYYGAMYFHNGSNSSTEYEYDPNGNLTKDLNKKISSIQYNLLNLPKKLLKSNEKMMKWLYDSNGTLLQEYLNPAGLVGPVIQSLGDAVSAGGIGDAPGIPLTVPVTDYCGDVVYYSSGIDKVLFSGGYVTFSSSGVPQYHFYVKDHLGSNRVVQSGSGTVEQVNHYYPFGALTYESASPSVQGYKYNGKELIRSISLDLYDYGSRLYDPVIGRFTTMDPLCEKYYGISPYAYCANNPINAIDPDGRIIIMADGVSDSFIKDFNLAISYLREHGAASIYDELAASPITYYIAEGTNKHSYFDNSICTIVWSPRIGLLTTEQHYLSATTLLNHEMDHALEFNNHPILFNKNTKRYADGSEDEFYYSPEEKRVITGSEQSTAKALGEINDSEVTREDHYGLLVPMRSSISNIPIEEFKGPIIYPSKKE